MRAIVRLCVCLVLTFICCGCAAKRVLIVTQYADDSPRATEVAAALRQAFTANSETAQLMVFNMDTMSHPTERWRDVRGGMAVVRANDALEPDLVLSVGDEAARYFAQRLVGTRTRIIFLGVKGEPLDYDFAMASNVTGVRERVPVVEAFTLMKELVPGATTVAVLADHSIDGDAVVKQIRLTSGLPLRVTEVRRAGTVQEWMTVLADLQGKVDVLCVASYGTVLRSSGVRDAVSPAELLRMTAAVNRVPDVSFWKDAVGLEGVMAAAYVPVSLQAEIAAGMAGQVLHDRMKVGQLPIETCAAHERAVSASRASALGIAVPEPVVPIPAVPVPADEVPAEIPETPEAPEAPEASVAPE